ncbi:arginine deiminase-related protein [Bartonella sp. HY329]|uniref:citrulline utilization hydrolase CtlX n=1 Tax=unclassified Bartonella TaxID=2645622 RepID=UPI0021C5885E|nr:MULTISPECIES: arginine deiminase-related protein [unclassified Bartonella]UXM95291.1 arginine deiminase-related protein [Bartonella sp. HY329]UXN09616.1 arginine deiminase-related protein [Bartonella sp. HY328]
MSRKQSFSVQAPAAVVMIRPHHFTVNTETAADNSFQAKGTFDETLAPAAYNEITKAVEQMRDVGITVHLYEDEGYKTPDSVFPNNWFSTHAGGYIAIYPMKAASRRLERRYDIIEHLKRDYRVQEVVDYSGLEPDGLFLEGTGAMVLDHIDRVAYAVKSDRTDPIALERFCTHFNFEPMTFNAADEHNTPIYHTNVLMCIATEFVMIGLDMITDKVRAKEIITRFEQSGRSVINLTSEQIHQFAGNAIELKGRDGRYLTLSGTAYRSLTPEQIAVIEKSATPLVLEIPTIEQAGGSVRCTIAGIHLSQRS